MSTYHMTVKSGKPGKAAPNSQYISRQGKFGKGPKAEQLVYKCHGNLPDWAEDNPLLFWKMGDRFERKNAAVYKELELALPNELTTRQHVNVVKELIAMELAQKSFQCAIHTTVAGIGGVAQPHVHIMFSDRLPDRHQRPPEQHFKRFNSTHPGKGGCRKDSGGLEPAELREDMIELRKSWADLLNKHLEAEGYSARVDHRSNSERGITRPPERHLGQAAVRNMTAALRESFNASRERP
ncbi:MAG: MobA/MobL family protein [Pseudomonadota bacterium]